MCIIKVGKSPSPSLAHVLTDEKGDNIHVNAERRGGGRIFLPCWAAVVARYRVVLMASIHKHLGYISAELRQMLGWKIVLMFLKEERFQEVECRSWERNDSRATDATFTRHPHGSRAISFDARWRRLEEERG